MEIIKIENVTKKYDDFKLQNFSLTLNSGQLFGILGPNGSGKSTLIKILTGQTAPTAGKIEILNTNPIENPISTKEVIGIIPEQESPPSFLTVKEYLDFVCSVRKVENSEKKIEHWLKFLDFEKEKNNLIKNISRGTKQKVLFIQSFIHEPKVVFIDEPLVNLDPMIQKKIKDFLVEYTSKLKNTIVLSTHDLTIAEKICTGVCILKNGKILFKGSIKETQKKNKNLEEYFIKLIENEK